MRPCSVDTCPALADEGHVYCPIHTQAQPAAVSSMCPRCKTWIKAGDLSLRPEGQFMRVHARCAKPPAPVERVPKRKTRKRLDLFDE